VTPSPSAPPSVTASPSPVAYADVRTVTLAITARIANISAAATGAGGSPAPAVASALHDALASDAALGRAIRLSILCLLRPAAPALQLAAVQLSGLSFASGDVPRVAYAAGSTVNSGGTNVSAAECAAASHARLLRAGGVALRLGAPRAAAAQRTEGQRAAVGGRALQSGATPSTDDAFVDVTVALTPAGVGVVADPGVALTAAASAQFLGLAVNVTTLADTAAVAAGGAGSCAAALGAAFPTLAAGSRLGFNASAGSCTAVSVTPPLPLLSTAHAQALAAAAGLSAALPTPSPAPGGLSAAPASAASSSGSAALIGGAAGGGLGGLLLLGVGIFFALRWRRAAAGQRRKSAVITHRRTPAGKGAPPSDVEEGKAGEPQAFTSPIWKHGGEAAAGPHDATAAAAAAAARAHGRSGATFSAAPVPVVNSNPMAGAAAAAAAAASKAGGRAARQSVVRIVDPSDALAGAAMGGGLEPAPSPQRGAAGAAGQTGVPGSPSSGNSLSSNSHKAITRTNSPRRQSMVTRAQRSSSGASLARGSAAAVTLADACAAAAAFADGAGSPVHVTEGSSVLDVQVRGRASSATGSGVAGGGVGGRSIVAPNPLRGAADAAKAERLAASLHGFKRAPTATAAAAVATSVGPRAALGNGRGDPRARALSGGSDCSSLRFRGGSVDGETPPGTPTGDVRSTSSRGSASSRVPHRSVIPLTRRRSLSAAASIRAAAAAGRLGLDAHDAGGGLSPTSALHGRRVSHEPAAQLAGARGSAAAAAAPRALSPSASAAPAPRGRLSRSASARASVGSIGRERSLSEVDRSSARERAESRWK